MLYTHAPTKPTSRGSSSHNSRIKVHGLRQPQAAGTAYVHTPYYIQYEGSLQQHDLNRRNITGNTVFVARTDKPPTQLAYTHIKVHQRQKSPAGRRLPRNRKGRTGWGL